MNKLTALLAIPATALAFASPAHALAGDPTVTVTASATVQAGTPITFHVTVGQDGYTPTCKITYRNPRTGSQINVANASAFTVDGDDWTYTPSLGQVGRTEVTTCSVSIPASGHLVRTVTGSVAFTVTA